MKPNVPSINLAADQLGPSGIRGDLVVVANMENDARKDQDRLYDSTPRPFKVFAKLGKTALIADSIVGDFGPDDGESYLMLPSEFVTGRVRWNGFVMDFKKNSKGEKSLVEFECTASSLTAAKNTFLNFALPFLDHQSYVGNCPIFVQTIRIEDICNQVQQIEYVSPYRTTSIDRSLIEISSELAPVFAMYREAKNSHSDFYKFLCYHKILDGLFGSLRASIRQRARKLGIELQIERDLLPNDSDIPDSYKDYACKSIKAFYDKVLTPKFRNAIAHFITTDGKILNMSEPASISKHAEIMYVSELCVRTAIETHQKLLGQLVAFGSGK